MKKILVISNTAFSIEKFRLHYLSQLSKEYYIDIYIPDKFLSKKNKIKKIFHKNKNLLDEILFLKNYLKKEYNFILVYSFKYQLIISLINLFFNKKIIYIVAGRGSSFFIKNFFKKKFYTNILKIFLNKKNYLCFINPEDKKFFLKKYKLDPKKTFLIPTEGVDVNQTIKSRKPSKIINFIFFARLIQEKGIEDYIAAAKIIKKKYQNVNFFVAGATKKKLLGETYYFNYKNYKPLLKKSKYIKYLGYVKNYKKIFPKMDCLIAPSITEGAGNSVLEAMFAKLFVIAYKNSGHNYILKNTNNLICKKNNVEELVKNIEKYLNINTKAIDDGNLLAHKIVKEKFSSENTFNHIKKIIKLTENLKSKNLSIVNFYTTSEKDFAYPRHLYIKKSLSKYFNEVNLFGCHQNHFVNSKKNSNICWINSLNYSSNLTRVISILIFTLKVFLNGKVKNSDYIYITDDLVSFIFIFLSKILFRKYKLIYEVRDVYPETLKEFYNLNYSSFIFKIIKNITKFNLNYSDIIISTLSNYKKRIENFKIVNKKFLYIPHFHHSIIKLKKFNHKFLYCGSINPAVNLELFIKNFQKIFIRNNKSKFYVLSYGKNFNIIKKKFSNLKFITFIDIKSKDTILNYTKKCSVGIIPYKKPKSFLWKFGISPRRLVFYINSNLIPFMISNQNSGSIYLPNELLTDNYDDITKKINFISTIPKKNLEKKINLKILKLNKNYNLNNLINLL